MPRKATAKEKASPQTEVSKRANRRSGAKQPVNTSPTAEERRSRRSSTAAQTAASVAEATRVTRSSRSQTTNRANSSDRKSTSREASLEPAEVRSSRRIIKKVNYQESEGDDEESQVKKVEKSEPEEEDYNAEDDFENDSDSGDVGRNKVVKPKGRSPPARTKGGRSSRVRPPAKEETPTRPSPRGRRAKIEKKGDSPDGENEGDFVAPSRKGRYEDDPEEETNVGRGRASGRRATRQAPTPAPPQRPTRTSRRQQSLKESKETDAAEEIPDDEVTNKSGEKESSPKKRKSNDDSQSKKRQKTEEKPDDSEELSENEDDEPMETDEVDTSDESKPVSTPGESVDKKTELKPDLENKTDECGESKEKPENKDPKAVALVVKTSDPAVSNVSDLDAKIEKEIEKPSPVKPSSETKSVTSAVVPPPKGETVSVRDKPIALTPDTKKPDPVPEDEKRKTELTEEKDKKPHGIIGGEPAVKIPSQSPSVPDKTEERVNFVESDAKPKDPQQNPVTKPVAEGVKCDGATFNGCATSPNKAVPVSRTETTREQAKAPLPSSNIVSPGNVSNSLDTATASPEKGSLASNGVHCNQNLDSKARSRKYVANGGVKEEERLSYKDRTFGFVSHNLGGDSAQASKSLLELVSQQNGIVCLQDISEEFYRIHLKSSFESRGYKVMFHIPFGQKSGLATLYKAASFSLKHYKGLALKEVIVKDMEATVSSTEDRIAVNGYLKNCGHMLLSHLLFNDRPLIVANVSVPPTDLGTHALQMSYVARETLAYLEGTNEPLLICGTFNMQENNAAYQLLRDGSLSNDMIELLQSKNDITVPGKESTALVNLLRKQFQHSVAALKSCYASVMGSELKVQGQNTTVPDLIWFRSDCLKTLGVLGNVEAPEPVSTGHLLLKADLAFF